MLLFAIGPTAKSIALGLLLSFVLSTMVGYYYTIKEYKQLPISDETIDSYRLLREMIPFGLTVVILTSMYLINSQFDRIMLGYFLPAEINTKVIGIYSIAISFSSLTAIFASSIGAIFYPVITEFWGRKNTSEIEKASTVFFRWLAISTTPLLLIVLVFPEEILTIVYGVAYKEGYITLMLYSIGLFIYSFSNPVQYVLAAMKKLNVTLKIIGLGALVNVVLNIIFIPRYGMNGAALTSVISFTIMTGLFLCMRKTTNLRIPRTVYKPILAGIITIVPLIIIKFFVSGFLNSIPEITSDSIITDIIRKLLKLCVLGALSFVTGLVYFVFLILFKAFVKEDINIILGIMHRMKMPKKWISFMEKIPCEDHNIIQ